MRSNEQDILDFLKGYNDFASPRLVGREVSKWRFAKDPFWARPLLMVMYRQGLVDADPQGHYRIKLDEEDRPKKKKMALAPHIAKILQASGKEFETTYELPDEEDTA